MDRSPRTVVTLDGATVRALYLTVRQSTPYSDATEYGTEESAISEEERHDGRVYRRRGQTRVNALGVDQVLPVIRATMAAARYCFLVTRDPDGMPRASLLDPFPPDAAMRVWIGTLAGSRKARNIARDPAAILAYCHTDGRRYVTLSGRAEVIRDPERARRIWKEHWPALFPGGPDRLDWVAIAFEPTAIEAMSIAEGICARQPDGTYLPVALRRDGDHWRVNE